MSNLKKYMPKVLSGVLSLTILCSTIGAASYSAGAKSTGAETTNTNISDNSSTAKNASEDKTKKLSKNETVSMEVLMKVCGALKCDIGDIMELISVDHNTDKQ